MLNAKRILSIIIDRPEKRNAITTDMYAAMAQALNRGDKDDSVHIIFIRGSRTCFTAGNDLADFRAFEQAKKLASKPLTSLCLTKKILKQGTGPVLSRKPLKASKGILRKDLAAKRLKMPLMLFFKKDKGAYLTPFLMEG